MLIQGLIYPVISKNRCYKISNSTHFCHFLATASVTDVLTGSNPMHRAQKRKASITGGLTIQWWAMRDVCVRLAPPAPRFVAPLLACCAGKRFAFPQLRTLAGSNPMHRAQKRKASITGGLTIQWWAMRDVCVRLAPPAPRFVAPLLACCAGKRFAFPQLRTLAGSNPMHRAQKRKASITGGLTIQWWAMRDSNPQPCACKAPALTVAPIARGHRV